KPPQRLGALLLVLCAIAAVFDRMDFMCAWLVAWWFCLGVLLGSQANRWMHVLTGGDWGRALQPASRFAASRVTWLLLLHLPLLLGASTLYPWAHANWIADIAHPGFKTVWLSKPFFTLRAVCYLFVWWWLARLGARRTLRKGLAAVAMIVYGIVLSLAAIDGLASLMPHWYSSAFGLVVAMGQFFAGTAFAIWFACREGKAGDRPADRPPISRDLGNLLMMYVMLWAYMAFTQFQIIWAENLPSEIAWYVPRLQTNWVWAGWFLIVVHFFMPQVLLLFRGIKDDPRRLAGLALVMLISHEIDVMWLVLPSVTPHSAVAIALAVLASLGMSLLLWGDVPRRSASVDERRASTPLRSEGTEAAHA
ncbi:MAG TPA: hypothetical protein VFW00_06990, partial [Rhodocyclaceae bacterium]|nr:hypothetical protein [Rhodocyclaceae bacterium]